MQPIINPMWFYLVEILDGVKDIGIICSVLTIAIAVLTFIIIDESDNNTKKLKKLIMPIVISLLLAILVPSKSVMYQMLVAKNITKDNIDFILETSKQLKNELKQDIVDIIEESKND